MARTNSPLPKNVADLTVDWFNEVIAPRIDTQQALTVTCKDGSAGRGFTTQVVRLSVQWASHSSGLPQTLIVKLALPGIVAKSTGYLEALEIERRWYESEAKTCPVRVPSCYYGRIDKVAGTFCLVLEDLCWMSAVDPADGLTADQARIAVAALADLHAYVPRSNELGRKPRKVPAKLLEGIEQSWDAFLSFCVDFVPERFYDLQGFLRAVESGANVIRAAPRSFIHGDYKLDNLLFGQTYADTKIAVLDWQGAGHAWSIEELAGFLPRSLQDEVAAEPLLSHYYRHAASISREKLISKDEFLELYRHALVLSLAGNVADTQMLLSGEWTGGDAARQERILGYSRMIFARKLHAIAAE
jgi:hypothetical protein